MRSRLTLMAGCLALGLVAADSAQAVTTFSPSQADLFNITDETLSWGGGGSLYTGSGTAYGLVGTDGVRYDMDFQPLPEPAGDGFSRVVLANNSFNTNLIGYDRFDILFQTETLPEMKVKTYINTGASGFFQSDLISSYDDDFEATRISIDLSGVPDLDDVRGFGIQMLVPGSPTAFAQTALVQTAPPFVETRMDEVLMIDSFERATLGGGATGDGWGYAGFVPGPTESDTTFTSTSVGATDGTLAGKLTRAGVASGTFKWGLERVWTSTGDDRPVPADANNDNPDDTAVPTITQAEVELAAAAFNQATHLAFDVSYDTADFDPEATWAKLAVVINDSTGAWYQKGGDLAFVNPQYLDPGVTTMSIELPLSALISASTSSPVPAGTPFGGIFMGGPNPDDPEGDPLPPSDLIILGFGTSMGNASFQPVAGSIIIDNLRLLERVVVPDLPGDLDGDGFVGINDLNIVLGAWNQTVTAGDLLSGDPSGDGFVGIDDLNTVLGDWNNGTPPVLATVPEPTTLALVILGGAAVVSRRR
jgi:hypothetical protein